MVKPVTDKGSSATNSKFSSAAISIHLEENAAAASRKRKLSVPIMAAMMLAVSGKSHHRRLTLPRWLQFLGWLATALMAVAVAAFAWASI